jgi:hypothetical protein
MNYQDLDVFLHGPVSNNWFLVFRISASCISIGVFLAFSPEKGVSAGSENVSYS